MAQGVARLCLERIVPPRRERPVNFRLPVINSVDHATKAMAAITTAVANGEMTLTEAAELSRVIESYVRAIEATEIERRLRLLEERGRRDAK
jgi:DNA-binding transcriptional regulator YbjK